MRINPFNALRPTPESAPSVASVPYDTVNTTEARELAAGNPDSFLHVIRPDIDLPDDIDPHSDIVYETARQNLQQLIERGALVSEESPCLYVYTQIMGQHEQTGLVACCHIDDYSNNRILKHEKTRRDKEDDRTRHVITLKANTGPVFLTYRDDSILDSLIAEIRADEPLIHIKAPDGVIHTVWRVTATGPLLKAFQAVDRMYVADGHHRSAAAARAGAEMRGANPSHTGDEEYNWFLNVLFPASQLNIMPYNRVVNDLNGLDEATFLEKVSEKLSITESASDKPEGPQQVNMYLGGKWYRLSWPEQSTEDPADALDVSILQEQILNPLLNIDDPRTNTRIRFIGGIRGTDELTRLVDSGEAAVAFSMHPVSVEEMMAIADNDGIMPPKSTWFEPKLRSGLFVHSLA